MKRVKHYGRRGCDKIRIVFNKAKKRKLHGRSLLLLLVISLVCVYLLIHTTPTKKQMATKVEREIKDSSSIVDQRTKAPPVLDILSQQEEGQHTLEEPSLLPGLKLVVNNYEEDELLERYANITFIYSFVNGTEPNHVYRRTFIDGCIDEIKKKEKILYQRTQENKIRPVEQFPRIACFPKSFQLNSSLNGSFQKTEYTNQELYNRIVLHSKPVSRDRESDELRYSLRSLEEHFDWHTGSIILVSPGHHPAWLNQALNFLASSCRKKDVHDKVKHHRQLTTVHQDSLLPYGLRLTKNTFVIENFLWRVKNITSIHLYWNDDYFVNQNVLISDLLNSHAGPILRVEKGIIERAIYPKEKGDRNWNRGVWRNNAFNRVELDYHREDYLPRSLEVEWERTNTTRSNDAVHIAEQYLDWSMQTSPELIKGGPVNGRRHRRFVTHAPFVYCTNMFRSLSHRYAREFLSRCVGTPISQRVGVTALRLFTTLLLWPDRGWAPISFFPYLVALRKARNMTTKTSDNPVSKVIHLDNEDGCAPATLLGGIHKSRCIYGKFTDNLTTNAQLFERINEKNPLFFNINGGFKSTGAAKQLRKKLEEKFPTATYLELTKEAREEPEKVKLQQVFGELMELPVFLVVDFEEGICPLVRSLQLALPEHRGAVLVALASEDPRSLWEIRQTLHYHLCSVLPSLACSFLSDTVKVQRCADPWRVLANIPPQKGVTIPRECHNGEETVHAVVIDARGHKKNETRDWLREAIAALGQTLSLSHFHLMPFSDGRSALYLSRRNDTDLHWITGSCETDLLQSFPLPYSRYENMSAAASFM